MLRFRIGIFLALRQLQKASLWTSFLIVTVITMTFLNLVVVGGILMGIVEGAVTASRDQKFADVILTPLAGESRIKQTNVILSDLSTFPEVASYSTRLDGFATIEANYKERRDLTIEPDIIAVTLSGINPDLEAKTVSLPAIISEGTYFEPGESGYILLGKYAVDRYAEEFGDVFPSLENIFPGTVVRVATPGGQSEEFIVKGIINSKIDNVSLSMYIPELEFRRLFGRADNDVSQIVIKTTAGYTDEDLKAALLKRGIDQHAQIETFAEAAPKFINDVADTFSKLSLFVSVVGLVVASITIFIVIFINALARRRQIGILKAIGISRRSITYAYTIQAAIYAFTGAVLGVLITHYALVPYFINNPIDFPYADAALNISTTTIVYQLLALMVVTVMAGFAPAWMIVRQKTLDSILGKK